MYDIFYLGSVSENYNILKEKFPSLKIVQSFSDAKKKSLTKFFWIIPSDVNIEENFKFDYTPDEWSHNYIHVFKNKDKWDGVSLFPRKSNPLDTELNTRNYTNNKKIDIVASTPKPYDVFEIDSYDEYLAAFETSSTEMFWMSSENISATIPDLYFTHDNQFDRTTNHAFIHDINGEKKYDGLFLCSKHAPMSKKEVDYRHPINRKEWDIVASTPKPYDVFEVDSYDEYLAALENSTTEMFWMSSRNISANIPNIYFNNRDDSFLYDRKQNHAFIHDINGEKKYDGLFLCSKHAPMSKKEVDYRHPINRKEWDIVASTPKPYDIVFISYQEPNADKNYQLLKEKFPRAKRIHGIKGIHQAHIKAASQCDTDMFWVVDADALIVDNFNFNYQVPKWDLDTVHVWRSQNPINDLVYGYGGVKLLPRKLTLNMDTSKPDMTTSITDKFKAMPDISNITSFNTDSFSTWRSAFRECVKLSSKVIDRQKNDETNRRLNAWCTLGEDRPYGKYAIDGACTGAAYGARNQNNLELLKLINDFDWLKEQFNARNF